MLLKGYDKNEDHPYGPVLKFEASSQLQKTLGYCRCPIGHVGRSSFQAQSRHVVKTAGMRDKSYPYYREFIKSQIQADKVLLLLERCTSTSSITSLHLKLLP